MTDVGNFATVAYVRNVGNFSNTVNGINACNFSYDANTSHAHVSNVGN